MSYNFRARFLEEPTPTEATLRTLQAVDTKIVTFTVRGGASTSAYGNITGSSGTITATAAQMTSLDAYHTSNVIRITWSGSETDMQNVQFS